MGKDEENLNLVTRFYLGEHLILDFYQEEGPGNTRIYRGELYPKVSTYLCASDSDISFDALKERMLANYLSKAALITKVSFIKNLHEKTH